MEKQFKWKAVLDNTNEKDIDNEFKKLKKNLEKEFGAKKVTSDLSFMRKEQMTEYEMLYNDTLITITIIFFIDETIDVKKTTPLFNEFLKSF